MAPGLYAAEEIAEPLLDQLAAALRSGTPAAAMRPEFRIPTIRCVFSAFDLEGLPFECAVFPDGLAYALAPPPWHEARTWSVESGLGAPAPAPTDPPIIID